VPLEDLELFEWSGILLSFIILPPMLISLTTLFANLSAIFHSRNALQLENLALRLYLSKM
jgi:hypothetical protein